MHLIVIIEPPFKSDIRDRLGVDTMPEYVAPAPTTQKPELNSEPSSITFHKTKFLIL
jgi:hypothetical protein